MAFLPVRRHWESLSRTEKCDLGWVDKMIVLFRQWKLGFRAAHGFCLLKRNQESQSKYFFYVFALKLTA